MVTLSADTPVQTLTVQDEAELGNLELTSTTILHATEEVTSLPAKKFSPNTTNVWKEGEQLVDSRVLKLQDGSVREGEF